MIAIDTNILLRYLLADDPEQTAKANMLMRQSNSVLITDIVLVETLWTLKGNKYRLDKAEQLKVMDALFQEPNIRFENNQVVWRALQDYRQASSIKISGKKKHLDLNDALIVNKAQWLAQQSNEPLEGIYTFDRAAQQSTAMQHP